MVNIFLQERSVLRIRAIPLWSANQKSLFQWSLRDDCDKD